MKDITNAGFDTICIRGGHVQDANRAHLTPIYASSTYTFDSSEQSLAVFKGEEKGYIYGRWGSPTIAEAEEKIALMEAHRLTNSSGSPLQLKALLHASGMGAICSMLFANVKSGQKILTHYSLYGGTHELIERVLPGMGIEAVIVDFHNIDKVEDVLKEDGNIALMYLETPANPTLQCIDLEALSSLGKSYGLTVCVDNTFATPYLQQPFKYDVDYVIHSTTKFLNGHGTAIGGVLLGRDLEKMTTTVTKTHRLLGANSNGFDAFVLTNGLRTLGVRMDRHCSNAEKLADYLNGHSAVSMVNYLGLTDHPDHVTAMRQMKHAGAMLSFELKGGYDAGVKFIDKMQMCTNAVSLGTCDTLISHPASTTHAGVSKEQRLKFGITEGLMRVSVGMENIEDILNDFEQAMR